MGKEGGEGGASREVGGWGGLLGVLMRARECVCMYVWIIGWVGVREWV